LEGEKRIEILTIVKNPSVDQDKSEDDPGNSHQSDVVSDLEVDDGSASFKLESDLFVDGKCSLDETGREDGSKHVDSTVSGLGRSWRRERTAKEEGRKGQLLRAQQRRERRKITHPSFSSSPLLLPLPPPHPQQ